MDIKSIVARFASHGTGSIRQAKWDLLPWIQCDHKCPVCWKKFHHRLLPDIPCQFYFVWSYLPCIKCLEYPHWLDGKARLGEY